MTADTPTPARIVAKKLTQTQRRYLIEGAKPTPNGKGERGVWPTGASAYKCVDNLVRMDLLTADCAYTYGAAYQLTPLGRAVVAELTRKKADNG